MQIENIPLLNSLPEDEIEDLFAVLRPTRYPAETVLFYEGDMGEKFYIILSGQVEILKSLGKPEEQLLGVRGPSDFFGEMSLLIPDGLRTASVRTRTPVQMLELSHLDLQELMERRPTLALEFIRVLSLRWRESDKVMIRDLKEKNDQLSRAYAELKIAQAQIIEKEKLEHELRLARDIQASILPKDLVCLHDFKFGARMLPARSVGGDFYDFVHLDENTVAISIGDVSDKGIPAAMFMALFCSFLRAEVQHISAPAEVLHRINSHLLNLDNAGMFVTALFGLLDLKTRKFTYARAGHEIPILFDQDGTAKQIEWNQGQLLGFFPNPKLDLQSVIIPSGSTLLLYTDGAFDARNSDGLRFGIDSLIETASLHVDQSPQTLCDRVIASLNIFQDSIPQYDDITLMAIKSSV